jgi:hypothetical protein
MRKFMKGYNYIMLTNRRDFFRYVVFSAAPAVLGPRSLKARSSDVEGVSLEYLTAREYRVISRMSREIIPSEHVISGRVNIALNIDRFMARNPSEDWVIMLRYLRLISLADPLIPIIRPFMPGIEDDLLSLKRVICFMGYYGDANGETDMPPEDRIIWPEIGFSGPKPDDWFPDDAEPRLDPAKLPDLFSTSLRTGGGR